MYNRKVCKPLYIAYIGRLINVRHIFFTYTRNHDKPSLRGSQPLGGQLPTAIYRPPWPLWPVHLSKPCYKNLQWSSEHHSHDVWAPWPLPRTYQVAQHHQHWCCQSHRWNHTGKISILYLMYFVVKMVHMVLFMNQIDDWSKFYCHIKLWT